MDIQLDKLVTNIDFLRWKYETCHQFWKSEYYEKLSIAKLELKKYLAKNYPKVKVTVKPSPYIRLADMTEQYENFNN